MNRRLPRYSPSRSGWRIGTLTFALLLCLTARSFAQSTPSVVPPKGEGFVALAAFTLPPTFYVGDHVELRVRLRVSGNQTLRPPAKMPGDPWIHVESISIGKTKDYSVVHIYFVSFAPGKRAFPTVDLGGISLAGMEITTASLVSEGHTRLTDPKGQLFLPGSTLILGVVIALLIGLPLAGLFLFRRGRRYLVDLIETRRARRPWRRLSRALDALSAEKPPLNPRNFYITLVDELRRYLTLKYGSNFRTVTGREFSTVAASTAIDGSAAEQLSRVIGAAELVKFARAPVSEERLRSDLALVRDTISQVEATTGPNSVATSPGRGSA